MRNKVNYIYHAINYIHAKHCETKEAKNIRQNSEKWDCNSFWWIFMAAFHLYWAKMCTYHACILDHL